MADPVETPQKIWEACMSYANVVFQVHDQVTWQRDLRLDRRMSAPAADSLSRTLLALRLYALSNDATVTAGRPLARHDLTGIPLTRLSSEPRQHYELFVGLDALAPDAVWCHWVNILKLLTYEQRGNALVLARIDAMIRTTADRLAARYRNPDLAVRHLRHAAGTGSER